MHGSILEIDFCPLADITGAIAVACCDLLVVYMYLYETAADRGAHCRDSQSYPSCGIDPGGNLRLYSSQHECGLRSKRIAFEHEVFSRAMRPPLTTPYTMGHHLHTELYS